MTDLRRPAPPKNHHDTIIGSLKSVPVTLIDEGACAGKKDAWEELINKDTRLAQMVCRTCPVQRTCLTYARDNNEPWGVWGGVEFPETKPGEVAA